MNQLTFEYPYVFLILFIYAACLFWCKPKGESLYFPGISMLQQASRQSRFSNNIVKFATLFFLVTALASPVIEDEVTMQHDKGYEISLILDASGSMRENNKFGIVKTIVEAFLKERQHDKIGMTLFADFAYVAVPLTYDKQSVQRLLKRLKVGIAGVQKTALYEALFLSSNLFKESHSKHKIAILLTDGIDNTASIPLDVAIKTLQKYEIKVYTIGIGGRGDYDPRVLREIALKSGGEFFEANSVERLQEVYATINKLEKSEIKANKYVKKSYFFQYPLFAGLLFLGLYLYLRNRE